MTTRFYIDQLRGDANTVTVASDAAFEQILNTKLTPDLADINRLAFVLKARIPSDDQ